MTPSHSHIMQIFLWAVRMSYVVDSFFVTWRVQCITLHTSVQWKHPAVTPTLLKDARGGPKQGVVTHHWMETSCQIHLSCNLFFLLPVIFQILLRYYSYFTITIILRFRLRGERMTGPPSPTRLHGWPWIWTHGLPGPVLCSLHYIVYNSSKSHYFNGKCFQKRWC